jgi:hypothetical protein
VSELSFAEMTTVVPKQHFVLSAKSFSEFGSEPPSAKQPVCRVRQRRATFGKATDIQSSTASRNLRQSNQYAGFGNAEPPSGKQSATTKKVKPLGKKKERARSCTISGPFAQKQLGQPRFNSSKVQLSSKTPTYLMLSLRHLKPPKVCLLSLVFRYR